MSDQVNNYMRLAENAYEVENYEEAYSYSTKVLEYEPDNWRATCIKGISATGKAKMADPRFNEMIATIRPVLYQIPEIELQKLAMKFSIFAIGYASHEQEMYEKYGKNGKENAAKYVNAMLQSMHLLGLAFLLFPNAEYARLITEIYSNVTNEFFGNITGNVFITEYVYQTAQMEYILSVVEKYLKEQNPSYHPEAEERYNLDCKMNALKGRLEKLIEKEQKLIEDSKSGCFIATAVYGDYEAPEVLVLRSFRDNVLRQSVLGRTFIRTYYATSPRIADWLRFHDSIKGGVKKLLDRFVDYLRDKE